MTAKGEVKSLEDITRGLENDGEAIIAVQNGGNMGKSTVVLAEV
jgi:NADPH-dependent curcumin reductase CurA